MDRLDAWRTMYAMRDRVLPGITEPSWRILLELYRNGPAPVTAACTLAGAADATGLRHIAALERQNMVRREPDEHDARRRIVRLTDWGDTMMLQATAAIGGAA